MDSSIDFVAGRVNLNGHRQFGNGFQSERLSKGYYKITLDDGYDNDWVFLVNQIAQSTGPYDHAVRELHKEPDGSYYVRTTVGGLLPGDRQFNFIVLKKAFSIETDNPNSSSWGSDDHKGLLIFGNKYYSVSGSDDNSEISTNISSLPDTTGENTGSVDFVYPYLDKDDSESENKTIVNISGKSSKYTDNTDVSYVKRNRALIASPMRWNISSPDFDTGDGVYACVRTIDGPQNVSPNTTVGQFCTGKLAPGLPREAFACGLAWIETEPTNAWREENGWRWGSYFNQDGQGGSGVTFRKIKTGIYEGIFDEPYDKEPVIVATMHAITESDGSSITYKSRGRATVRKSGKERFEVGLYNDELNLCDASFSYLIVPTK